jgi:hypothetical protein
MAVGGIGAAGRDYVQDERYIAIEHMDVRRDCFRVAQGLGIATGCADPSHRESFLEVVQALPQAHCGVGAV